MLRIIELIIKYISFSLSLFLSLSCSSNRGGFYYERMVRIIELIDKYINFFPSSLQYPTNHCPNLFRFLLADHVTYALLWEEANLVWQYSTVDMSGT
jgi:hypothetical protein